MKGLKLNKKIVALSLILLIALVGLVGTTVAWLTSTDTKNHSFTMGEVSYTITESGSAATNPVVPGQDLFANLTFDLANASTIATQVRVKITVVDKGTSGSDNNPISDLSTIFVITPSENWSTSTETSNDGYYYYCPSSQSKADANLGEVAASTGITFKTLMKFDGSKFGNGEANANMGKQYTITFTFEVKQLDEVKWADMANIDFKTGLAKVN